MDEMFWTQHSEFIFKVFVEGHPAVADMECEETEIYLGAGSVPIFFSDN